VSTKVLFETLLIMKKYRIKLTLHFVLNPWNDLTTIYSRFLQPPNKRINNMYISHHVYHHLPTMRLLTCPWANTPTSSSAGICLMTSDPLTWDMQEEAYGESRETNKPSPSQERAGARALLYDHNYLFGDLVLVCIVFAWITFVCVCVCARWLFPSLPHLCMPPPPHPNGFMPERLGLLY